MLKEKIESLLLRLNQPQLKPYLKQLSTIELQQFFKQITLFSSSLIEQQNALRSKNIKVPPKPLRHFDLLDSSMPEIGCSAIAQGKVACLILAGGEGSRLQTTLPKALIPITKNSKKTLLQLLCERAVAASEVFSRPLQLAAMTSSRNHHLIETYLKQNCYFGLSPHQFHLFQQGDIPLLDEAGNWFIDHSHSLAIAPNGNGTALYHLMESGIGEKWLREKIQYLAIVPIDNPLADPFDPILYGYHIKKNREASIKGIHRNDPYEPLGIVIKEGNKIAVREYTEIPCSFEAPIAHIGLFCFDLSFIAKVCKYPLPWHCIKKEHQGLNPWKFEKFLFDVLTYANSCGVIVYPRDETFAPLKNKKGNYSLNTVQKGLLRFHQKLQDPKMSTPMLSDEINPILYYRRNFTSSVG